MAAPALTSWAGAVIARTAGHREFQAGGRGDQGVGHAQRSGEPGLGCPDVHAGEPAVVVAGQGDGTVGACIIVVSCTGGLTL
jgi:hypothetical protein